MRLLKLRGNDSNNFAEAPEIAMDSLGRSSDNEYYAVVGCRVGIPLNEDTLTDPQSGYLDLRWLRPGISARERGEAFGERLDDLPTAPQLTTATAAQAWQSFWNAMSPVTPIGTLPPTPFRPASINGHLPFKATTYPETVIYRWEAYPTSLRIDVKANPPTIAADTYAAPASEVPFAQTGFAAVAVFALPSLKPACFRYELQRVA
jgi:hypothetical protein